MRQYLEFEKPVAELESKIEELRRMTSPGELNIAALAEDAGGAA
jgi:acetyl-CoA carboxylase carboxyl transferase subunit alpha